MDWDLLNRQRDFFPDDMPIEVQVNRVFGQIERVMQDTGRSRVIYDEGYFWDLEENEIRAEDSIGSSYLYDNVGIPLTEAFKYLGPIRVHEDNSFSASTSLSKTLNYQMESGHDVNYQMNVEYLRLSGSFTSNDWDEGLSGTAAFYARFSSQAHSSKTDETPGVAGTAETLARYQSIVRGTVSSSGGARARTISSDGVVNDYEIDTARVDLELAQYAGGRDGANFYFHILNE